MFVGGKYYSGIYTKINLSFAKVNSENIDWRMKVEMGNWEGLPWKMRNLLTDRLNAEAFQNWDERGCSSQQWPLWCILCSVSCLICAVWSGVLCSAAVSALTLCTLCFTMFIVHCSEAGSSGQFWCTGKRHQTGSMHTWYYFAAMIFAYPWP